MSYLWVQFKQSNPTRSIQVATKDCDNVDQFIEEIKKKFSNLLGSYDADQIFISLTDGGTTLESDIPLIFTNTVVTPIFISVIQRKQINTWLPNEIEIESKLVERDPYELELKDNHWLWQSSTYDV